MAAESDPKRPQRWSLASNQTAQRPKRPPPGLIRSEPDTPVQDIGGTYHPHNGHLLQCRLKPFSSVRRKPLRGAIDAVLPAGRGDALAHTFHLRHELFFTREGMLQCPSTMRLQKFTPTSVFPDVQVIQSTRRTGSSRCDHNDDDSLVSNCRLRLVAGSHELADGPQDPAALLHGGASCLRIVGRRQASAPRGMVHSLESNAAWAGR